MRALFALPLLMLAACGDTDGGSAGMSTNIVDEQASYDVSNVSPAQDESLAPIDQEGVGRAAVNAAVPITPRSSPAAPGGTIPAAIQGRWTGLNDACGDRSAELELTVTPNSLIFHESVGTVIGVASGVGGRVRVDAAFTGEGDSWTRKLELRPSANGRELIVANDGTAVTRKRC
ncbi:MAG TPA: hypothetical protein VJM09_08210 [Sphingobium sp.]|nr:hypothetical protein [Sphingobium sp.]